MLFRLKFGILLTGLVLVCGLTNSYSSLSSEKILDLVNADREKLGLPTLNLNPTLNLAALAKAEDMISNRYFAHTSPKGIKPWYWFKTLGYNYAYAGENLAIGYKDASSLENSWMNSDSHRSNILSPYYSDMGLAIIKSEDSTLIVQLFGTPHKLSQAK